ncbi:DMT family transporter [Geobacter sp. AOG1]|uniref:DMT family transporter n=1 Tax=Geobacter sp. AOG1 TaxID=1566346 RepID=UPI001CC59ADA|nr:DMT family transporter [Geobacter sp. AOG1]GFE56766.1 EamA family transporter [Geobacter sp. AOG1]
MNESTKGTIYAILAVLLFATLGAGFKLSVARLDGYVVVVYMGLFAVTALLANLVLTGRSGDIIPEFRRKPLFFILTGVIGLGVQQLLCVKSYEYLPAAQVVILTYTYPLMMIVLAWAVYRERSTPRSVVFVLVGFFGVYVLISRGTFLQIDLNIGTLLSLTCAFSFALFCVLIKHARFHIGVGMFLFNLFGLLFLLCLLPFYGVTWQLSLPQLLGLVYLGVFPTAVAFILWNKSLQLCRTSHSSNFALLTPVLSLVCIAVVLGERIFPSQIAGMAIIVGAVFLNVNFGGVEGGEEGKRG